MLLSSPPPIFLLGGPFLLKASVLAMPRENRKRGKKHKKQVEHTPERVLEPQAATEEYSQPSWIRPARVATEDQAAPFGYVDPDVKAYFRSVDVQMRGWAEANAPEHEHIEDRNPSEGIFCAITSPLSSSDDNSR